MAGVAAAEPDALPARESDGAVLVLTMTGAADAIVKMFVSAYRCCCRLDVEPWCCKDGAGCELLRMTSVSTWYSS